MIWRRSQHRHPLWFMQSAAHRSLVSEHAMRCYPCGDDPQGSAKVRRGAGRGGAGARAVAAVTPAHPAADGGPVSRRLPGRGRQPRDPHAQPRPLGARGWPFRAAYSSMPTCTPARSGLLTGLAPWNHGMLRMVRMAERYTVEKPRWRSRLLHHFHRKVPLSSAAQCARVSPVAARRIRPRESPEYRSDYRSWFWSQAPTLNPDATGIGWNDYPAKPTCCPERLHPTFWTGQTAVNFIDSL